TPCCNTTRSGVPEGTVILGSSGLTSRRPDTSSLSAVLALVHAVSPSVSAIKVTPSKRFIPTSLNGDHLSSVQRNSGCSSPCMRRQGNGIAKSCRNHFFFPQMEPTFPGQSDSNVYAATDMPELVCLDLWAEGVGMSH